MKDFKFKDPRWPEHARNCQSSGMGLLLGLGLKDKLPAEGMPERQIQGVTVWVKPLEQNRKRTRGHRVFARCPDCGREMSAGRLHQHRC